MTKTFPFKNLRIRKLIGSAVLAWSLVKSPKSASLDQIKQKQNNSVVHEKVIKNEFNSLDDSNTSGKIIRTGNGTILTFQQDVHDSSLKMDEVESPYLFNSISRGGNLGKSGPGPRAKADARARGSRTIIIPGANGVVPQNTYCQYHKSDPNPPLSCKPRVKVSNNPFQDDGNNLPPEEGSESFDPSKYKGGPSPFKEYKYDDPTTVAQNLGFNQPKRLDKSYDKHAQDCFGLKGNRNKENLKIFKGKIQNLAQSADEVYRGSYRYKDPAYIFLKEVDEEMTAVVVNATDFEYITTINPTEGQMDNIQLNGDIGLDTRPSMQLTLRLRGPKGQN